MEEFYRLDEGPVLSCSRDHIGTVEIEHNDVTSTGKASMFRGPLQLVDVDDDDVCDHHYDDKVLKNASDSENISDLVKTQIAKHPGYPDLVAAHIECKKIGAPPETASLLEEIRRENHTSGLAGCSSKLGADPELDNFMESYCEILQRLKDELSKPFDEATIFFSNIQSQLNNLCEGAFTKILDYDLSDKAAGTNSDQEEIMAPYGEADNDERPESCEQDNYGVGAASEQAADIKEMLRRKYSGFLNMFKTEFFKKRKKVELPKPARAALLEWWNDHYMWPYPTGEEKAKLSVETGLDEKQINNWFVNQRKRHWKPSENIKSALMEGVSCGNGGPSFDSNDGSS